MIYTLQGCQEVEARLIHIKKLISTGVSIQKFSVNIHCYLSKGYGLSK